MAKATSPSPMGRLLRGMGRALVVGMPHFLKVLGLIGIAAMIWVGGGIILHGFEAYGLGAVSHVLHETAEAAAHSLPAAGGVVSWLVQAAGSGLAGIGVGLVTRCVLAASRQAEL